MTKNKYSCLRSVAFVALMCASSVSYGMEITDEITKSAPIKKTTPEVNTPEIKELKKIRLQTDLEKGIASNRAVTAKHEADAEADRTRMVIQEIETQAVVENTETVLQTRQQQAQSKKQVEEESGKARILAIQQQAEKEKQKAEREKQLADEEHNRKIAEVRMEAQMNQQWARAGLLERLVIVFGGYK
jgi:flagellar biosynthesis GTPase FlhF